MNISNAHISSTEQEGNNLIEYMGEMRATYDSLISGEQKAEISYGEGDPELPKLILRAANMSGVSEEKVISSIEKWEDFKRSEGILDLQITPKKEIALAVYIYCYNDVRKDTKILDILKELRIGEGNSNIGGHIQELCRNHLEPSLQEKNLPRFSYSSTL